MKKKIKKELTDRERLMLGYKTRIAHKEKQLKATRKFHREVEAGLIKKINLDKMQLRALKRIK